MRHPHSSARLRPGTSLGAIVRLLACVAILGFSGCGLLPDVVDETTNLNAEQMYKLAHDSLTQGNYTRAVKLYESLEARFPYGRYAQQAILELAYANYRAGETAAAVAACDRFIRTFPNNQNVDYAYYLKGLVNFREDQGLLGYVYELDLAEREPKGMRESFAAFKELVAKFPDSRYAQDATDRMLYLTNSLAKYEVNVARYYYNRGAYIAAINRAQAAIVGYPRTMANEGALDVLVKSYDKLGLVQLRDDSLGILRQTFPDSIYLAGPVAKPWWKLW
ncbi:MAG: outer membrane protein assembly factor BamD [Casimicrobiaceae bacterium]